MRLECGCEKKKTDMNNDDDDDDAGGDGDDDDLLCVSSTGRCSGLTILQVTLPNCVDTMFCV